MVSLGNVSKYILLDKYNEISSCFQRQLPKAQYEDNGTPH